MKTTTCVGLAILFFCCHAVLGADADSPALRIRPIQIVSCGDMPEGLSFNVKPSGYKPGLQVYYLIEGQGIAGFDSLEIDTIKTREGVEISKDPNGMPAYAAGPFPKATADGKYCIFSLVVNQVQFGRWAGLVIKGNATVLLGTQRAEKTIDLKAGDTQEQKLGPFTVRVVKSAGRGFLMPPPFAIAPRRDSRTAAPTPDGESGFLGVEISGPLKVFIQAKFTDAERDIQGSSSWDDHTRTYSLPKPKSGKVTMTMSYWGDVKRVKCPIGP
jgi:hypothetical protein